MRRFWGSQPLLRLKFEFKFAMTTWRIDLWHASVGCQLVTNGFIKKDQFLEVSRFWNQQFFWVHVSSRYFQLVAIAMKFCQVYHMFIMHATEIQQMVFLRDMLHFDDSSWCVWLFLGAFLLFTTSFKSLEKKAHMAQVYWSNNWVSSLWKDIAETQDSFLI